MQERPLNGKPAPDCKVSPDNADNSQQRIVVFLKEPAKRRLAKSNLAMCQPAGKGCMNNKDVPTGQYETHNAQKSSEQNAFNHAANSDGRGAQVRKEANQIIAAINVAAQATEEIDKIIKSISGIVTQADNENIPDKRRLALQSEANTLVAEINHRVQGAISGPVNPLLGEPIKLEVTREIGRAIEVNLPQHARDLFGLGPIDLSRREMLGSLHLALRKAQEQLQELKSAVGESRQSVESVLNEVDVALQNAEASQVSVRELDEALQIAKSAKSGIADNPHKALSSYTGFSKRALSLLE